MSLESPFWKSAAEWLARGFFAILLAAGAIAATMAGGFYFATFVGAGALAAVREWHRMVSGAKYAVESLVTATAVAAGLVAAVLMPHTLWPLLILVCGTGLSAAAAALRKTPILWNGAGTIYIGLAAVSMVELRVASPYGAWVALYIFIINWIADTGALFTGRFLGGPKLAPALSPNKTWAGMAGGTFLPASAAALYIWLLGGAPLKAGMFGFALAIVAHLGDLFESWVKRGVGRKNSGGLIPGHGGVLDRIDSTLFIAPAGALLVFVFGVDLLFGAAP